MKAPRRKRVAFSAVVALLVALGVPVGLTVREVRQHQRDRDFLEAIKINDVPRVLRLLDQGADLKIQETQAPPLNVWQALLAHLHRQKPEPKEDEEKPLTALDLIYSEEPETDGADTKPLTPENTSRAEIIRVLEAKQQRAQLKAILERLAHGTVADIAGLTAPDGILITRRQMDWKATEQRASPFHAPLIPIRKPEDADRLLLNGLHGKIYHEEEVMFAPDELYGNEFAGVFAAFTFWMRNTLEEGTRNLTISTNLNAAGYNPRYVGPAVQGETDSDTCWRIYFVHEAETAAENSAAPSEGTAKAKPRPAKPPESWRIWKLELESRMGLLNNSSYEVRLLLPVPAIVLNHDLCD